MADFDSALPTRSLIIACDVDLERYEQIVSATCDIEAVGAYKVGASLCLSVGLPQVVKVARRLTSKPLIYDHQKAGTDIPQTSAEFMRVLSSAGLSAVILFPFAGPATQSAWSQAALDEGLGLIVGGHMTHENFLASHNGYIEMDAVDRIYQLAADSGIKNFVVPGNNPDAILRVRELVEKEVPDPIYYAPGFITQGGQISDAGKAAGKRLHAIVGRAIYEAHDIRQATESLAHSI